MSIVFMTGCDGSIVRTGDLAAATNITNPFGINRTYGADLSRFSNYPVSIGVNGGVTEGGLSFWLYNTIDAYNCNFYFWDDATTNFNFQLAATTRVITVACTGETSINTGIAQYGVWALWDVEWKIHDTTGYVRFYKDKLLLGEFVDVDTNHGSNTEISKIALNAEGRMHIDDIVFWDTTAGGWSSRPTKRHRIRTMRPNADTSEIDWSTTGGNHWGEVDEDGANDGDTTSLSSATTSDRDRLDVESYDGESGNVIVALAAEVCCKTDVSGTMKIGVRETGGSEDLSAAVTPQTAYGNECHVSETNPGDAAAWEPSDITAAQLVLEHVS